MACGCNKGKIRRTATTRRVPTNNMTNRQVLQNQKVYTSSATHTTKKPVERQTV